MGGDLQKDDLTIDAFKKLIADSTTNTLDLQSTYPFSAERLRYNINGTVFRNIDDSTKIDKTEGSFLLLPDNGDNVTLYSAERPLNVVGYEAVASMALRLNRDLESGDTLTVGTNDFQSPENAAFFELNGDGNHRAVMVDQGMEVASESFELPERISSSSPIRYAIQFNWYGVGRHLFTVSYTDPSESIGQRQKIKSVAELSVEDDFSNSDPNQHVFAEVSASTTDLEVDVGSFGYNVLGDVIPTSRVKSTRLTGLQYDGTNNNYEVVAAGRIEPDYGNIFCQLQNIEVIPDNTEGELLVIAASPSETDASNFSTPVQHSENNSIWLQTTDVTTFPDEQGNVVSTSDNPNGRQVGFSSSTVVGLGSASSRIGSTQSDKRPIYEDDRVLFLYKSDSGSSDTLNIQYQVEQLW